MPAPAPAAILYCHRIDLLDDGPPYYTLIYLPYTNHPEVLAELGNAPNESLMLIY